MQQQEIRTLTELLKNNPRFCYLRLGDGELAYIIRYLEQGGASGKRRFSVSGHKHMDVRGGPGLEPRDAPRLLEAYRNCDYLDLCDRVGFISENIHKADLIRGNVRTSPSPECSLLGYRWFLQEFKDFGEGKVCLFCGAEAQLLKVLFQNPEFVSLSRDFYPHEWKPVFVQPRDNGADISRDLDLIKQDLSEAIDNYRPDILFLSLGGAAKILASELSREKNVRAFDFGATLRGLVYSGTVGYGSSLPNHHTIYYRVPLRIFYPALKEAHPDLHPVDLLKKVQGQLILELEKKVIAETVRASKGNWKELDLSPANLFAFDESFFYYKDVVLPELINELGVKQVAAAFNSWRLYAGLGWDGRLLGPVLRSCDQMTVKGKILGSRLIKLSGLQPLYWKIRGRGQ